MEIEHFVGIGAILAISVLLVWIVWSCFCSQDKTDLEEEDEEDYDPSHSDNFSSTHQITRVKGKASLMTEGKSEKDLEAEGQTFIGPDGAKKSKKGSSSYRYSTNKYGLDDPFGEWTVKEKFSINDGSPSIFPRYPKSPSLKHKFPRKDQTVIDI